MTAETISVMGLFKTEDETVSAIRRGIEIKKE
jgi:hypothetical protein